MKLSHGLVAVGLSFAALAAHAEVTGTVTAVTDYDFRGISLNASDPALQGSIDWAHESGFYAGAWASSVDSGPDVDGDIEVDLYVGFSGSINDDLGYDVGLVYYTYPDSDDVEEYPEIYAGLSYKWFDIKQWYTNDYGGSSDDAFYTEINGTFELPKNFGLTVHAGYNYGDAFDGTEYYDYSIGLTYTLGHFDFGLKYVDTTLDRNDELYSRGDLFKSTGRAVFSISTTFPWSQE
jgi:uncharacterized protein (TIGR02001 family)